MEQQPNDRVERDLRVRKGGSGRDNVSFGSYTLSPGDKIIATDGDRGTVVSVDDFTVTINWGEDFPVVYPINLPATLRKALPWE